MLTRIRQLDPEGAGRHDTSMTPELISLTFSSVAFFVVILYVRSVLRTAGADRQVDPLAVQKLFEQIDWSHADRVLDRKKP